jgi:putative ABC transport system permease protein
MSFLSAVRVALGALMLNKGRSILTSLGIVIGISAVIAMVSAGNGARYKLDDRLSSVGKNLILVRPGSRSQQGFTTNQTPLTSEDASAIRKQVGPLLTGVAESRMIQMLVSTPSHLHGTVIVGSVPDLERVRNWKMSLGRFYTEEDVKGFAPLCLLGQVVRQKLFPDTPDPIGKEIRVGNIARLRVAGVLGEKGRAPTGADQDDQVFVPITTLEHLIARDAPIQVIVATARSAELVDRAKEEIVRVMREQHHLKVGASDDFDVSTVQEMSELAVVLTRTMQLLTAVIASISLLVGGIGIMNIMLVSVTERTREIGIRMAIGATPWDVMRQFLIEAVVLALIGGIIGITLGLVGAIALAHFIDWPLVVDPQAVALAFGVSAGVGIFFGFYPARKASRLDPIEALRFE